METEKQKEAKTLVAREAAKAEVEAEFDRRLASLRAPDTRQRVEAVMAARGRGKTRPKVGSSF